LHFTIRHCIIFGVLPDANYAKMIHRLKIIYTKDNQEKSLVSEIKVTPPNHSINDAVKILHDACVNKGGVVVSIMGLCGASDELHHTEWIFEKD
jgi:hypothetical protein